MNKEGADMQNRTLQVINKLFIIKYFKQSGESRYYFEMDKETRTLFIGVFDDLSKIPIIKKKCFFLSSFLVLIIRFKFISNDQLKFECQS